jgi:hypothetical protein
MTKAQQAMVAAFMYPDGRKRGPKDANSPAIQAKLSRDFLTKARAVLKHSSAVASEVLAGATFLNAAFEDAKSATAKSEGKEARLADLQRRDLDLAELVLKGTLDLKVAEEQAGERREDEKTSRAGVFHALAAAFMLDCVLSNEQVDHNPPPSQYSEMSEEQLREDYFARFGVYPGH